MTDKAVDRDAEIQLLLARLGELAGDPSDIELREAFSAYRQRARHAASLLDLNDEMTRLVARIDDDSRREQWCSRLSELTGLHIGPLRRSVNANR